MACPRFIQSYVHRLEHGKDRITAETGEYLHFAYRPVNHFGLMLANRPTYALRDHVCGTFPILGHPPGVGKNRAKKLEFCVLCVGNQRKEQEMEMPSPPGMYCFARELSLFCQVPECN